MKEGGEHVREREREKKQTNKMEVNTYTPAGLKALNDHLTEESYISGYVAEKNEKNWVGCERNQRNKIAAAQKNNPPPPPHLFLSGCVSREASVREGFSPHVCVYAIKTDRSTHEPCMCTLVIMSCVVIVSLCVCLFSLSAQLPVERG